MKNYYNVASCKALAVIVALTISVSAFAQQDSAYFVSDSSWFKSTVTTPSNVLGYWNGVHGVLPALATYTIPASVGQPYGYFSIHPVDSAKVIKTGSSITYFRKLITLDTLTDISVRLRTNVDDHIEVYINGMRLAGEYDGVQSTNWKNPPIDVLFKEDGSVINGYMGGTPYDTVTGLDMDSLFVAGVNEIIVVCRNLSTSTNLGGFSFRLDIKGEKGVPAVGFIVSNNISFTKSTVATASSFSGNWLGVNGVLPASATYTLPAVQGQPYGYQTIDAVPEAQVIKTGNNITYFRYNFELTRKSLLNVRVRTNVDDAMEVYVNGLLLVREGNMGPANWKNPSHDIKFKQDGSFSNGFMGGDSYDAVTFSAMGDIFYTGMNELVLVVRNQPKVGDAGGFSFRMDIDANGAPVIKKSAAVKYLPGSETNVFVAEVYPNPSSGWLNVALEDGGNFDVQIFDMNGRILTTVNENSDRAGIDISAYAQGIYFVKVISGSQSYTAKLMKQ